MSAVAFTIIDNCMVLCSDGMAIQGGRVHSLKCSKIHKISDQVAILWMGMGAYALADPLKDRIEIKRLAEPQQIATEAGHVLQEGFRPCEHVLGGSETGLFWVTTMGYNSEGNPEIWQLDSRDLAHRYRPRKAPCGIGQIGSMVVGFDYNQASFARLLATKYAPLAREQGKDVVWACQNAFEEMLSDYEQTTELPVGGKRFLQVLTPAQVEPLPATN